MSKDRYQVFYEQHRERIPVFVHPWYLDAVCDEGEWNACIIEEKGKITAVLPYFIKKKYGFRYITMPPFVKFMGPYFANPLTLTKQHDLLQQLMIQLPKTAAFTQNFYYNITNWLPFYWQGFQQTTRYSYQLNVSDLNQVYDSINRNMRRNIKKAQAELTVSAENLPLIFYDVNKLSFERQKLLIPYTFSQFQQQDASLAAHSARQVFFAKDNAGKIHAAAYLIWDAQSSYYHLSGDDPVLRQSGAGILLIWEAIQFTKEKLGLNTFDFEGSIMPNVEAIRRQFGAVQVPYFTVWKYNSRLYKSLQYLKRQV
jgi:hypothetical protein